MLRLSVHGCLIITWYAWGLSPYASAELAASAVIRSNDYPNLQAALDAIPDGVANFDWLLVRTRSSNHVDCIEGCK